MSTVLEYIWIDAKGELRSKARTISNFGSFSDLPLWNFDGSSTGQAVGNDSEVILVPRAVYNDPFRRESSSKLVLCDCYDRHMAPVPSNTRFAAAEIFKKVTEHHPWFGLEQEYVLYDRNTNRPLGWPISGNPEPQGKYYCGVGADKAFGREIVEEHFEKCLKAGLTIAGINGEVMPGQWEFQIGPCEGVNAADQLWLARYILYRVCEEYNVVVDFSPKPQKGDWNGSGCHTNFSTERMRADGGINEIYLAIERLGNKHQDHISVYGDNSERLIGTHETSSIDKFTFGVADRTTSIRIPLTVQKDGKGYFEDRRPAANSDPYLVTSKIAETCLL